MPRINHIELKTAWRGPGLNGGPDSIGENGMTAPDILEPFILDHVNGFTHRIDVLDRSRAAVTQIVCRFGKAGCPIPLGRAHISTFMGGYRLIAGPHKTETGRHHQALLTATNGYVNAPVIHQVFDTTQ